MKLIITKCPICGEEMIQDYIPVQTNCDVCGKNITTNYVCSNGHHFCNSCRFSKVYSEIKNICMNTDSKNPLEIAELITDKANMSLLGCKHYFITTFSLYTAYKNCGGKVNNFENTLDAIAKRIDMVQTSICKLGGFCGIPMAVGGGFQVAEVEHNDVAEITRIANKLSGNCMARLISPNLEGSSDCCIRNSAICMAVAAKFIGNNYWVDMELPSFMKCKYSEGNPRCNKEKCRFYNGMKTEKI